MAALPQKLAPPLANESMPDRPVRWEQPEGSFPYKVQNNDTWENIAQKFQVKTDVSVKNGARYLMFYNFFVVVSSLRSRETNEVNWYLRNYVGCNVSEDGGKNWAFSNSADPGTIFVPFKKFDFEGDGEIIYGSMGVGNEISVPAYDDSNILDSLSKALDIYGLAELTLGIGDIPIPVLAEAGLIATGALAGVVGPILPAAGAYDELLRSKSRDYFFEGFSIGLVMSANGASRNFIGKHELHFNPLEPQFVEKSGTFKQLQNYGLQFGIQQGKKFNTVDKNNFFAYLHSQLTAQEQQRFNPRVPFRGWTDDTKKAFYDRLSSIVKRTMLQNDLKLKFR